MRRVVARALATGGHRVSEAPDTQTALEMLGREPFDVVVTDWNMPGMRGDELLREIRRLYPTVDVFMMTAYGTVERAVEAMKAGAVDYITKPLDLGAVRRKLEMRFAERRLAESAERPDPLDSAVKLGDALGRGAHSEELVERTLDLIQATFDPVGMQLIVRGGHLRKGTVEIYRGERGRLMSRVAAWAPLPLHAHGGAPWRFLDEEGEEPGEPSERRAILVPLETQGESLGSLLLTRAQGAHPFTDTDARALRLFCQELAAALMDATRRREGRIDQDRGRALQLVTQMLVTVIETYDDFTFAHSRRVAEIARDLAELTGLDRSHVERVRIASLLHDIGKVGVGNIMLHKVGELSDAEFDLIRLHPTLGARILSGLDIFSDLIPLVLHHHEWWDGSGYPDGLKGPDIPVGARIIGVADVYDSLVSDRPYRRAFPWGEAMKELRAAAGTQLDPWLVELWLRYLGDEEPLDSSLSAAEVGEGAEDDH